MENDLIPDVEGKIISLRGQQVILDCDVAELYGVATKEINQAVKNNPRKFPEGYIFELDNQEFSTLRSNFLTTKFQKTRQLPKAFTERGLYMLATILKGERAEQTTLAIVETYAKLKELSRVIVELPQQEEDTVMQKQLLHRGGQLIEDIINGVLPKQSLNLFHICRDARPCVSTIFWDGLSCPVCRDVPWRVSTDGGMGITLVQFASVSCLSAASAAVASTGSATAIPPIAEPQLQPQDFPSR